MDVVLLRLLKAELCGTASAGIPLTNSKGTHTTVSSTEKVSMLCFLLYVE